MEGYPSALFEEAVNEFNRLPGVGRKTAARLALFMLKLEKSQVEKFGNSIIRMRNEIRYCRNCNNISDQEICSICSDTRRDQSVICVVEDVRDVMAIEHTRQFRGTYHVLGGKISPMEGTGPSDLFIDSLIPRAENTDVKEIIFALSTTIEGDTTNYYLYKKLAHCGKKISVIARGIAFGDELEYADEVTLGRSILQRTPYERNFQG